MRVPKIGWKKQKQKKLVEGIKDGKAWIDGEKIKKKEDGCGERMKKAKKLI